MNRFFLILYLVVPFLGEAQPFSKQKHNRQVAVLIGIMEDINDNFYRGEDALDSLWGMEGMFSRFDERLAKADKLNDAEVAQFEEYRDAAFERASLFDEPPSFTTMKLTAPSPPTAYPKPTHLPFTAKLLSEYYIKKQQPQDEESESNSATGTSSSKKSDTDKPLAYHTYFEEEYVERQVKRIPRLDHLGLVLSEILLQEYRQWPASEVKKDYEYREEVLKGLSGLWNMQKEIYEYEKKEESFRVQDRYCRSYSKLLWKYEDLRSERTELGRATDDGGAPPPESKVWPVKCY